MLHCIYFPVILYFVHGVCCQVNMNIVAVFEKDYPLAERVFQKVLDVYAKEEYRDVEIQYTGITLTDDLTEKELCEKMTVPRPVLAIDTTRQSNSVGNRASSMVKRIARKMGIPMVSATSGEQSSIEEWKGLSIQEEENLKIVSPPGQTIQQAIKHIILHQETNSAGVLVDKSIDPSGSSSVLLADIAVQHRISNVESSKIEIEQKIKDMKTSGLTSYFLVGRLNFISQALEVATALGMTTRQFAWYLISTEKGDLTCNANNFTVLWLAPSTPEGQTALNIARGVGHNSEYEVAFYYDLLLYIIKTVRLAIMGLNAPAKWPSSLDYGPCVPGGTNKDANFQKVDFVTRAINTSYVGLFGPFDFSRKKGAVQVIQMIMRKVTFNGQKEALRKRIGTWKWMDTSIVTKDSGIFSYTTEGAHFADMQAQTTYKVTTFEMPPFVYKVVENGTTRFEGYCVSLLEKIAKNLNFEYEIFETEDKQFGMMNDKLEWNGMMRDLVVKKADIALGPISVMAERETVVDFTVPYYDLVGLSILMKKPSVPPSLFKFLTVLEANVWGCILAAYFVTSFLMFLFDRLSPYSYYNNKEKFKDDDEDEKRDFSLKESLWFCMTSLTPQGGGEAPRNLSGRLVAATWWLFGFIIIASYTANLAAFLTVSRLDSPIESLDDLAKQYKIKYAPQEGTTAATYFERMAYIEEKFYEIWKNMSLDDKLNETERAKLAVWDYPVSDKYTKIWWTMQETKLPKTFDEGIKKVLDSQGSQDGFAFIADATQVKYAVMTNCELVQVGSEFSRKPLALAVQQDSPLKDQISSAILQLLNQRELEGLKEDWWNKNKYKKTCDDSEQTSDGISIENIGGVFIVIFIGVALAVLTLGIEYIFFKKRRQRNTRVVTVDNKYPDDRQIRQ